MTACTNHPEVTENVFGCARCSNPFCSDCLVAIQGRRYCARCKAEQLLDIRSGIDVFQLPLAGVGRRFAAIFVDGLILGLPIMVVMFWVMIPMFKGNQTTPPSWIAWVGWGFIPVYIIYEGVMLRLRGQTLGKIALGIKVVQPTGRPLTKWQPWFRAVIRSLFVSFLSLFNYLPAFFTREKTCIHDLAARTRVVIVD